MSERKKVNSVLVTGASTGIGFAVCQHLLENGYFVVGSVRKAEDATRLQLEFGDQFLAVAFDVSDHQAILSEAARLSDHLHVHPLMGIVNNAGVAVAGPLEHLPLDQLRHQFEVNVIGQMAVIQAFLPFLEKAEVPARIINISSVSGLFAGPFIGPYAASKFAMEALTDSLRRELLVKGIDVISIAPASVKTPIWEKAKDDEVQAYQDTPYFKPLLKLRQYALKLGENGMKPERIAKTVYRALTTKKPKARYILASFLDRVFLPMLPKRTADRLLKAKFGLKRQK